MFQSSIGKFKTILVENKLTDEVANSLYQNKGIISLEEVKQIKGKDTEDEKALSMLISLHQLILQDDVQFKQIMCELESFKSLQLVIEDILSKPKTNI